MSANGMQMVFIPINYIEFNMDQSQDIADFVIFVGRFHPLIVHMPIGILFLAALIHFLSIKSRLSYLKNVVSLALAMGAVSAILACIIGYMLTLQGGYDEETLSTHMWYGIIVAILSVLAYIIKNWAKTKQSYLVNSIVIGGLVLVLFLAGHQGGNLTHGSNYLTQFAPDPIRTVIGLPKKEKERPPVAFLDSADIFLDIVQPILNAKCVSCHNKEKSKGDLILSSFENILLGGKNKNTVVSGNLEKSELIKRIHLPEVDKEAMPPKSKTPLTENEIKALEIWISFGAKPQSTLAEIPLEKKHKSILSKILGLEPNTEDAIVKKTIPGNKKVIDVLISKGFKVNNIAESSNYLEVTLNSGKQIDHEGVQSLLQLKEQIVSLNLKNVGLKNEHLTTIGQLKNLSSLNINSNPITDEDIKSLVGLKNLTKLNVYGTAITDQSMDILQSFDNLSVIYAWNTKVTLEKVKELKLKKRDLSINLGVNHD